MRFVFITVDPERDTADRIKTYLNAFEPALVGLRGSEAKLEPAWKAYGVYRQKSPGLDSGTLAELVEHSGRVYLVDAQGNLRLTYPTGLAADDVAQDLRYLLRQR